MIKLLPFRQYSCISAQTLIYDSDSDRKVWFGLALAPHRKGQRSFFFSLSENVIAHDDDLFLSLFYYFAMFKRVPSTYLIMISYHVLNCLPSHKNYSFWVNRCYAKRWRILFVVALYCFYYSTLLCLSARNEGSPQCIAVIVLQWLML